MNMLRYMQPFHTDHIPRILLTGNNLHRAYQRLAFKQISINVLYKHNDDTKEYTHDHMFICAFSFSLLYQIQKLVVCGGAVTIIYRSDLSS